MDLQDVVGSHLHRLLIANVCYRIRSFIDSTDFPIVRFLCYFSQVDGVFSPPSHVTEMVAALQYFIRVVVLNLGRNSTIEDVSSHEPVPAYHQFVREGLQTPFAQIREIMHLASSFAVNQTSVPRVYWLNDVGTSLLIDGNRIDLEHIRSWIARGIKETSNLLYGLVMKGYRCVSDISISEDYRNLTPGYSFLSSDNVGAEVKNWIAYLSNNSSISEQFVAEDSGEVIVFDKDKVCLWLSLADKLVPSLETLIHMTSGQPSRASELAGLTFANPGHGVPRKLTFGNGRFVSMIPSAKAKMEALRNKGIPRFLAGPVSKLLLHYLVYVRLFQVYLSQLFDLPGKEALRTYFFASPFCANPLSPNMLRVEFKKTISTWFHEGKAIGISQYRQLAVAMARFHLTDTVLQFDQDNCVYDLQAGHSTRIANQRYGRDQYTHIDIDPDVVRHFERASDSWQDLVMPTKEEGKTVGDDAIVLPTPVSTHLTLDTPPGDIHGSLALVHSTIQKALTLLYGPSAKFKSITQEAALQAVLARDRDLLCILPTGGGKSLLFELPAIVERDSTTVVILPLIALLIQFGRQFPRKATAFVWTRGSMPPPNTRLVFISAEDAARDSQFPIWFNREYYEGRLNRLVLDETHLFLYHSDFRTVLHLIVDIRDGNKIIQLVFLTATMPPHDVPQFKQFFRCHHLEIIRDSSNRSNIRYAVQMFPSADDILPQIAVFIAGHRFIDPLDRGIVYCTSRATVTTTSSYVSTATDIRTGIYHGQLTSEEKEGSMKAWQMGETPWIVATSAFGMGIHHPAVRFVLHYGQSYGLVDYHQETGRLSRDGQPGDAITFAAQDYADFHMHQPDHQLRKKQQEMSKWLSDRQMCRRRALSHYFDERESVCGVDKNLMCDNCSQSMFPPCYRPWLTISPRIHSCRRRCGGSRTYHSPKYFHSG